MDLDERACSLTVLLTYHSSKQGYGGDSRGFQLPTQGVVLCRAKQTDRSVLCRRRNSVCALVFSSSRSSSWLRFPPPRKAPAIPRAGSPPTSATGSPRTATAATASSAATAPAAPARAPGPGAAPLLSARAGRGPPPRGLSAGGGGARPSRPGPPCSPTGGSTG